MIDEKKTLQYTYPQIASEWDYGRNMELTPLQVSAGSNKKVWWICSKGHNYECAIGHRTSRNQGCPYCSGQRILSGFNDLKTRNPELAGEWNYNKNGDTTPDSIALNSHKKYWWQCHICNYEWEATPNDRSRGRACPICAKSTRTETRKQTLIKSRSDKTNSQNEELISEWDFEKNTDNPDELLTGSKVKVWWKCRICGNTWQATINNRLNGSGCPKCMKHMRTSFPEQAIFFYLSQSSMTVINGYTDVFDNRMELDIYIPEMKLGIEYDGVAFHSGSKAERDMITKYEICQNNGIRLIRVSEFENHVCCYDKCFVRDGHTDRDLEIVLYELLSYLDVGNISIDIARDRTRIMQQYITVIHDKSLAVRYPEIAMKWDEDKNGGLKADQVNAYSNKKYWWKCSLGHSYQATPVCEVTDTKTCPICSNHRVLAGFNDLAYKAPELAKEWDIESNYPVTPSEVIYTSPKKYWWICPEGHKYYACISNRYIGKTGCPYCSNTAVLSGYNDLATTNPELLTEWNYSRNGDLSPESVMAGCNKKVWWICNMGHEWEATVNSRAGKTHAGCPYCSNQKVLSGYNDLATTNPDLLIEWDYEKNVGLNPNNVSAGSNKKVWWKCKTCGNIWYANIVSRAYGQKAGCPRCGYKIRMQKTRTANTVKNKRDLVTMFPEIAKEWDYEKNERNPSEVSYGANLKIWWKCSNGHSYQAWLTDRTGKRKTGCPYCHGKRRLI